MRHLHRVGGAALAAVLLVGCAAPASQYIAAKGGGMYFALPRDWQSTPTTLLGKAQQGWSDDAGTVISGTLVWQGAWRPGRAASAAEVFSAQAPVEPLVYAFSRTLIDVEQTAIGSDPVAALQDVVIPATELVAGGADVSSRVIRSNGYRGIDQVATYMLGGQEQALHIRSMLSSGNDRLHVLVVRCTTACFDRNADTIADIFDSLTFKETNG